MNINFETKQEADGTYTVVIRFTDIPDEQQATAAGNLVKRALYANEDLKKMREELRIEQVRREKLLTILVGLRAMTIDPAVQLEIDKVLKSER